MSAAHTPGPWISSGEVKQVNGPDGGTLHWCGNVTPVHEVGGYRGEIAVVQSCDHIGGITREEAAANACLLAAAPNLLAALEYARNHVVNPELTDVRDLLATLNAAIAKAKGAA